MCVCGGGGGFSALCVRVHCTRTRVDRALLQPRRVDETDVPDRSGVPVAIDDACADCERRCSHRRRRSGAGGGTRHLSHATALPLPSTRERRCGRPGGRNMPQQCSRHLIKTWKGCDTPRRGWRRRSAAVVTSPNQTLPCLEATAPPRCRRGKQLVVARPHRGGELERWGRTHVALPEQGAQQVALARNASRLVYSSCGHAKHVAESASRDLMHLSFYEICLTLNARAPKNSHRTAQSLATPRQTAKRTLALIHWRGYAQGNNAFLQQASSGRRRRRLQRRRRCRNLGAPAGTPSGVSARAATFIAATPLPCTL